jgi:hypothetical protein
MNPLLIRLWKICCAHCVEPLRLWCGRPDKHFRLRPGPGLEIPLHPHPGLWHCAVVYLCLHAAYVWQLAASDNALLAGAVAAAAVGSGWLLRRMVLPRGSHAPRRLRVLESGELVLFTTGGRALPVRLRAETMRLGSVTLLILQGERCWRLVLGAANVQPVTLAALRRRLR